MKTVLTGRITSATELRDGDHNLTIEAMGKVQTSNIASQVASLQGTFKVKSLVASQMKIGATLTIIVTDENSQE